MHYYFMAFTLFNDLPTDIRCLIWSHAMPGPRIHRITRPEPHLPAIGSCHPPLNLLLACHESHDEVLHNLRRLPLPSHDEPCPPSHSTTTSKSASPPCCPYILFNPFLDTLYLPGSAIPLHYHQWFSRPIDFSLVRHLAVDVAWSCQHPTGYDEGISIPTIVSQLGNVQDLYIVSERSYFRPVADDSVYQDVIARWGKIIPIEGRGWNGKGRGVRSENWPSAEAGDGGCWGWVEPVDMYFWEELTQASGKEAWLAAELHEERDRQMREGGDSATRWSVPRVEMRFLRLDKRVDVKNAGPVGVGLSNNGSSSNNLGPAQPNTVEAPAVDGGPTNHEIVEQRWAWSRSPRNAGLRFSTPLLERLGFRKGGKGKFKMPYEL